MAEPYENLFHGAARIGGLCGRLGLPWQAVAPFVGTFSEELEGYLELSIGTLGPALGVMTRGDGKHFVHRFCGFMEDRKVSEPELRRFLARAAFFQHRGLYTKLDVGPDGIVEYSYYFRMRPDLDVVRGWLSDRGTADLGVVDAVAKALDKRRAAFLATSLDARGHPTERVYFTATEGEGHWPGLVEAAMAARVPRESWAVLAGFRNELDRGSKFLALSFDGSVPIAGAQVYFTDVDDALVRLVLARAGTEPDELGRLGTFARALERTRWDYAGFRLVGEGVSGKVYGLSEGVQGPAGRTVLDRWFPKPSTTPSDTDES